MQRKLTRRVSEARASLTRRVRKRYFAERKTTLSPQPKPTSQGSHLSASGTETTSDKSTEDVAAVMHQIGVQAKSAASRLAIASTEEKQTALRSAAAWLKKDIAVVLAANEKDMLAGEKRELSKAMLDRLKLDEGRIDGIVSALNAISELADPVGQKMAQWDRPNGLEIERVRTPLGVIGVIFESRPLSLIHI